MENDDILESVGGNNEKDWFAEQYEKLIGKPLAKVELSTDEVVKKLEESTKYRWIPEAKKYKITTPQAAPSHYIEWNAPPINACACPYNNCTCKGDFMFPRKNIPRVNIRGAEYCVSRCIRCYGPRHVPRSKSEKQSLWGDSLQTLPIIEERSVSDIGIRKSHCSVTTQSTVGSNGELIIGDFSHVLYGTLRETIMKDIEGTQLHISSLNYDFSSDHEPQNLGNFNKLLRIRELISVTKLKNKIALLKQNIYPSFFETKEKNPRTSFSNTQCVEDNTNDSESKLISIDTPFKDVMIKTKNNPQESTMNTQTKFIDILKQDIIGVIPDNLKKKASDIHGVTVLQRNQITKIDMDEKPSMLREIKADKSAIHVTQIKSRPLSEEHKSRLIDSSIRDIMKRNDTEWQSGSSQTFMLSVPPRIETKNNDSEISKLENEKHVNCKNNSFKRVIYSLGLDQLQKIKVSKFRKYSSQNAFKLNKDFLNNAETKSDENCTNFELKPCPKTFEITKIKSHLKCVPLEESKMTFQHTNREVTDDTQTQINHVNE